VKSEDPVREDRVTRKPGPFRPGVNFINVLCTAFVLVDPESIKNTVKASVSFYAFRIYERKSRTLNVDEIEPRSIIAGYLKTASDKTWKLPGCVCGEELRESQRV